MADRITFAAGHLTEAARIGARQRVAQLRRVISDYQAELAFLEDRFPNDVEAIGLRRTKRVGGAAAPAVDLGDGHTFTPGFGAENGVSGLGASAPLYGKVSTEVLSILKTSKRPLLASEVRALMPKRTRARVGRRVASALARLAKAGQIASARGSTPRKTLYSAKQQ